MTRYETLINKADNCRQNAIKAESDWARDFWMKNAEKLEREAANLPLIKASEVK